MQYASLILTGEKTTRAMTSVERRIIVTTGLNNKTGLARRVQWLPDGVINEYLIGG